MVALIATTPMMMAASASPPVKREIPAAAVVSATGRELTCSLTTSHTDRGAGSGSLLGPYISSLLRATSLVNPAAGDVCHVAKAVATSKQYHAGACCGVASEISVGWVPRSSGEGRRG